MIRIVIAAVAVALLSASADAGPFRRTVVRSSTQTCVSGECGSSSASTRSRTVVRGGVSAQAHAEAMASRGRLWHTPADSVFEGIGEGSTATAAIGNCCNNGGAVIDQGVAYGHGRWFACVRRR